MLMDYFSEGDPDREEGENLRTLVDGLDHVYGEIFDGFEYRDEKHGPHGKLQLPVLPPQVVS